MFTLCWFLNLFRGLPSKHLVEFWRSNGVKTVYLSENGGVLEYRAVLAPDMIFQKYSNHRSWMLLEAIWNISLETKPKYTRNIPN